VDKPSPPHVGKLSSPDVRKLSPPHVINIADLRRLAQRRLPKLVFDYLDGGAEAEVTLRENCLAFEDVTFRPRQAVVVRELNLRTKILAEELAFPGLLAPIGYSRMIHPEGELAAARAAGEFGTTFILSTISGHKLEKVKAVSSGPLWYQLYLVGGQAAAEAAIARIKAAGYTGLVITVDTAVAGMRERDPRNGMKQLLGGSLLTKLPYVSQVLSHPGWLFAHWRDGGMPKLENIVVPGKGPMPLIDVSAALADSAVEWKDFAWIRKAWTGPLIVKGVLTGDDARRSIDEGASAVVVSNHGGRQLDGVSATMRALPEVVAAVGKQAEVLMDGGIRRGADLVKALCLGARGVLIGRAYGYGLGAAGYPGVVRAMTILREDVERTMRLLGCSSIDQLDSSFVNVPGAWGNPRQEFTKHPAL
jgi:L-lactate dehydrogenase (cytochrome)